MYSNKHSINIVTNYCLPAPTNKPDDCANLQDYVRNVHQTCTNGRNEQKLANTLSNLALNCKPPKKRGHHKFFLEGLIIF